MQLNSTEKLVGASRAQHSLSEVLVASTHPPPSSLLRPSAALITAGEATKMQAAL